MNQIKKFLKKFFCKHKHYNIMNWYWTHGVNGNEPCFIVINYYCTNCGKRFSRYLTHEESYKWVKNNPYYKGLEAF